MINNQEYEYKTSYQYLTSCVLNLTDDCNLACRYCFVQQHPNYMTLDTAKKAVDWLYNNLIKKEKLGLFDDEHNINLTFFGGEPMLCFKSIIEPLVYYCELKYPDIFSFDITTNGTLLNKQNIDFLKKHNFKILLSIDGNKHTQNYNRPLKQQKIKQTSFNLIKRNFKYLSKNFPDLECRATIYADTVQNLFKDYLYIESLKIQNWDIVIDTRHPWSKEKIQILKDQMSQIYFYKLKKIINNKPVMIDSIFNKWILNTIKNYDNNNEKNNNNDILLRCGLGTTSGAIGWDGSIYGCQEQVSKENINLFYIGNIFNGGIDIQKHSALLAKYYNDSLNYLKNNIKCENCALYNICSNSINNCPSLNYDLFVNMQQISDIECEVRKIYFNNSLALLKILFSINNKKILDNFYKIIQS